MIIRNNKRKLFSSALSFEEITSLSHEIAKKVISGELTKEEAIVEVMNKANWSYSYADAAVSSWIENEPTYNGMTMTSSRKAIKSDLNHFYNPATDYIDEDIDENEWEEFSQYKVEEGYYLTPRRIKIDTYTVYDPNEKYLGQVTDSNEILNLIRKNKIESSRKPIESNSRDDKRSYEINRENKATLSWGDFCDSLSEDFVMDGIFRTVPGDHHWSEVIGDLVVVLSVSEDNPLQGNFSLYKRGNFKKPLRTEYKRFNDADEAKELMYQFIESNA